MTTLLEAMKKTAAREVKAARQAGLYVATWSSLPKTKPTGRPRGKAAGNGLSYRECIKRACEPGKPYTTDKLTEMVQAMRGYAVESQVRYVMHDMAQHGEAKATGPVGKIEWVVL